MDLKKEREAYEAWAKISIENFVDLKRDEKFYVTQENSRLTIRKKEFLLLAANRGWKAWQERAKAQVPEGFVLVEKCDIEMMLQLIDNSLGYKSAPNKDDTMKIVKNMLIRIGEAKFEGGVLSGN